MIRRLLSDEVQRRQSRNRRYSLRAFARDLGLHHTSLSRILRGGQRVRTTTLAALAARLRFGTGILRATEDAEIDRVVLAAIRRRTFRPDVRWIASVTGVAVHDVQSALHRLLRDRLLVMTSRDRWVAAEATV